MKNYKISLAGDLGSGKSTVGDVLAKKYSMEKVSVGVMLRDLATEHGMNVIEFNKYMETHPEIDYELDNWLKSYESMDGNFLFDSRLAWHFVPSSFSVYIKVSTVTAAERIMGAGRSSEIYKNLDEAVESINARHESELLRYKTLYNLDLSDMSNYDLVVDTDGKTPSEIASIICNAFEDWLKQ
jgi:cytidylate kinase